MITVLVVASDEALRARLVAALGDHSVFVAQSDTDALKTLRLIDIDVILIGGGDRGCSSAGAGTWSGPRGWSSSGRAPTARNTAWPRTGGRRPRSWSRCASPPTRGLLGGSPRRVGRPGSPISPTRRSRAS